jgi:site-specific DNA recombinase
MEMVMSAIGYIRVSTTEQVEDGVSLAAQEEKIRAYAALHGLELLTIIREAGVSASVPLAERPAGAELLRLLKGKKVRHVIAIKLDRLFRDAADALAQTRDWDRAGVALHLIDVGGQTINTSTAMGRMFLTMMAGFAELERNLIAERTSTAMQHMKAKNQRVGAVPYGFSLAADGTTLLPLPEEQAVIAEARRLHAAGVSFRGIAAELARAGHYARSGKPFEAKQVWRMVA